MRKSRKIVLISIIVTGAMILVFTIAVPQYYQQKYFIEAYEPQDINTENIENVSSAYQIQGIPWISYEKAYCESAALQMVAYKTGMQPSIGYINFLSGFTYGAFYPGDPIMFLPYNDPITGSRHAAPYFGLEMRYLTTNDPEIFLNAVRSYISRDYPVCVQLNVGMLWEKEGLLPHSELIIGYDESSFHFYETSLKDQFLYHEEGLVITESQLIESVSDLNQRFGRPWEFALAIFENQTARIDISDLWRRNGESLVGYKQGPISWGANAIKDFASSIKEDGEFNNLEPFEALSYTRLDNALFLEEYFNNNDAKIKEASILLRQADMHYDRVLSIVSGDNYSIKDIDQVKDLLLQGADFEEQVGEIFILKSEKD